MSRHLLFKCSVCPLIHFNASSIFLSDFSTCTHTGIETEWRKTLCMPREVCLDVGKEFGAATNTFYKPPCVSVYRCGGCCNSEEHQCMNISTSYISKTVSLTQDCTLLHTHTHTGAHVHTHVKHINTYKH